MSIQQSAACRKYLQLVATTELQKSQLLATYVRIEQQHLESTNTLQHHTLAR